LAIGTTEKVEVDSASLMVVFVEHIDLLHIQQWHTTIHWKSQYCGGDVEKQWMEVSCM